MHPVILVPKLDHLELERARSLRQEVLLARIAAAKRVRRKRRLLRWGLAAVRRALRARRAATTSARLRAEKPLAQRSLT